MNNKLFSIIGCRHGHISSFIHEMIGLGYICAGIYEPDEPTLAKGFSQQFGIPLIKNLDDALASEVSIVGSSAINNEKINVIERCEKQGKHIMLDKPIVTCRDDLERLEAVIRRGVIQVGMLLTSRNKASIYTLKQKIDEGQLGKIVSLTMRKPHRLSPDTRQPWHFSKQQNGGIIIDLLIHDFDLLRWLTGREVLGINSFMAKNILPEYPQFYDTATVQVQMEGDILAQLYTDWHTPDQCWAFGDCRIFVSGTKGCAEIRLFGDPAIAEEELMYEITNQQKYHQVELISAPVTVIEDFLHRIEEKAHTISHQDLLLACKASIEADEQAIILKSIF